MNLGPVSTGWLNEIGIFTEDDLRQMGVIEAYCRVREIHPNRVTVLLLYGLEAALIHRHWNDIPPEYKAELRAKAAEWKPNA